MSAAVEGTPSATATEPEEVWLCVDCTVLHENDEAPAWQPEGEPAPLALISDRTSITCNWDANDDDKGIRDFSHAQCEGCGSYLAGTRYRYAQWSVTA